MSKETEPHAWDFVQKYYPKYERCNDIARADDLQKLLDGEINGHAEKMLHRDYGGDENNPQIQIDYDALHKEIYQAAIENFIAQKIKMTIKVEGGIVQEIGATDPDAIRVVVLDHDDQSKEGVIVSAVQTPERIYYHNVYEAHGTYSGDHGEYIHKELKKMKF